MAIAFRSTATWKGETGNFRGSGFTFADQTNQRVGNKWLLVVLVVQIRTDLNSSIKKEKKKENFWPGKMILKIT